MKITVKGTERGSVIGADGQMQRIARAQSGCMQVREGRGQTELRLGHHRSRQYLIVLEKELGRDRFHKKRGKIRG